MKRIIRIGCGMGTIAALLLALPIAIAQTISLPKTWVRISTDEYESTAYVDRGSIKLIGNGQFRFYWAYVTAGAPYPDKESGQLVYVTGAYVSTDCKKTRYRIRQLRLLDRSGNTIRTLDYGDSGPEGLASFHPAATGSYRLVCNYRPPQPAKKPAAQKKPAARK